MSKLEDKWGEQTVKPGFAQVPLYLLGLNRLLPPAERMKAGPFLVLIQLASMWRDRDTPPFPSMSTLAALCGTNERTVQRHLEELERAGLIRRVKRRVNGSITSNQYDLAPVVALVRAIAAAFPPGKVPTDLTGDEATRLANIVAENRFRYDPDEGSSELDGDPCGPGLGR